MKTDNLIKPEEFEQTPADLAISWHLQNLFATYGEEKVRASMNELFGMKTESKAS